MPRVTMADIGLALVAVFLPPLAVFIKKNIYNFEEEHL